MSIIERAKKFASKTADEHADVTISKLKEKLALTKGRLRDATAREKETAEQLGTILGVHEQDVKNQRVRKAKPRNQKGCAAILLASDWHVEETVEPELVNYRNKFNIEIAWSRIERFAQKGVEMIACYEESIAPVDEIWLALMGDLMSGYIHEELVESNEMSPVETVAWLREALIAVIDYLLAEWPDKRIFVPTCQGNHGRTTQKMRVKTSHKNSYEWLLYTILAGDYADNPRVEFFVGKGYHNLQVIKGRLCRFHHGDAVRYQGGVGGISIPVNKAIAAWNKEERADFDFFGHYHQFMWAYPSWVSNGCLIGYSPYALKIKADFQHPTQTIAFLDSGYGITEAKPLFLEKEGKRQEWRDR
jgi:hypothetical protein